MKPRSLPLHPYVQDPLKLFAAVADSMQNRASTGTSSAKPRRTLLGSDALRGRVRQRYAEYRAAQTAVAALARDPGFDPDEREALNACYGSNRELENLKAAILQALPPDNGRCCLFCSIGLIEGWDHYLPQNIKDFPEFSIFPDNLIPTCDRCNGFKKTITLQQGQRTFIHAYYDRFNPSDCFLEVTFNHSTEDLPQATFGYSKATKTTPFGIVFASHCDKLGLLPLYNDHSRAFIAGVPGELRRRDRTGPVEETASAIEEMADDLADRLGSNHPKAALYKAASRSQEFVEYCRRPRT